MAYFSNNRAYPTTVFPTRYRHSEGHVSENFSVEEGVALGIVEVEDPPTYDPNTQSLSWSGDAWVVSSLSEEKIAEIVAQQWHVVREQRDAAIADESWYIEKYNSEVRRGVTPTIDIAALDAYVEVLRNLPNTQSDPFNIVWPDDWKIIEE